MPRELTRQSVRQEAAGSDLEITVRQDDRTVWVALSGILDRRGVANLMSRVAPLLASRGCRIVLDGTRLVHLDFRATHGLVAWSRRLRDFHHQLYLKGWSDYLKAILVMEDWDRELGTPPAGSWTLDLSGGATTDRVP